MKPLNSCFLYGIVDLGYVAVDRVATVTAELVQGGVDVLQLRAKEHSKRDVVRYAEAMLPVTKSSGVPLILNDYPDLLREVDAEGCHVGQEDGSISEARELAGRLCIVGRSTHSIEQARAAQTEGADYVGFGPLFPTGTKPSAQAIGLGGIRTLHELVQVPIFCIGGVKLKNLEEIVRAGARRVCIVSDLLLASDVAKQTAEVKAALAGTRERAPTGVIQQSGTSGMGLSRDPRVAAPVDKRGAKENTACGQTGEAAYRATGCAQVQRITRKRPMNERQQTDR